MRAGFLALPSPLNPFDLAALMKPLMHRTDLSEAMVDLSYACVVRRMGELVAIPDWEDTFGLTLHDALRSIKAPRTKTSRP